MKQIISKRKTTGLLTLFAVIITLLSFTTNKGGEGYEIYIDNKLVLQQYGNQTGNVKSLQLSRQDQDAQMIVKYWHCGRIGKSRQITIRDAQNRMLKQWNFGDAKNATTGMSCKVKDIVALEKGKTQSLNLYYSSSELPKEKLLASIQVSGNNVASVLPVKR